MGIAMKNEKAHCPKQKIKTKCSKMGLSIYYPFSDFLEPSYPESISNYNIQKHENNLF